MGNALSAIEQVLADAGEPLHYTEITRRVLDRGLWRTDGQTPEATVNAQLTIHLKKHGTKARIRRVGSGMYELNGTTSNVVATVPTAASSADAAGFARATSPAAGG